jgi:MtfA peptidase
MWKQWRRKKLLNAPFPPAWRHILEARVPLYSRLPEADRRELQSLIQVFMAEKNFEGCGGLVITDEIKLCITAQACLLLLHRRTDYYRALRSILVYPSKYYTRTVRHLEGGVVEERGVVRLGEAWHIGAVVLAWDAVCAGMADPEVGTNVVLHEFAHLLDFEDGHTNGTPLLDDTKWQWAGKTRRSSWTETLTGEFERLRAKTQKGEEIYLNVYGTTNPAEFFAVATESFFEFPHKMKSESPKIYDELKQFYRQDPAQWTPLSPSPSTPPDNHQ